MTRLTSATISRAVSPLELFFDLVFVFAVLQLSHHLLEHLTWQGAAETAVLLVAVYCVWAYTSFAATLLNAEAARQRWVILAVMFLGLIMNAAISRAFAENPWAFVIPLLVGQLCHGIVTMFSAPTPGLRAHYRRMTVWLLVGGALWMTGAAAGEETRILWWGGAAVLDLIGTWLAHPWPGRRLRSENISFDAAHMVERCQLFLIIALGETILATGSALAAGPLDPPILLAGALAFVSIVALWALYFGGSDRLLSDRAETTDDPIRAGRMAMNGLVVAVAGLVALAVGHETVIHDPHGETTTPMVLLLFGGPILYILTQAWALRELGHPGWRPRIVTAAVLVAAGGLSRFALPPLGASLLVAVVLCGLVAVVVRREPEAVAEPRQPTG
jgi:low temperature requirement protein LtrA